jgi:putative FmdB family regulatory protein
MPTYDYECHACHHKFEAFQSIKAAPIKVCPICGKSKARRLIGMGGGLIFKGSGFYCTDYRDSGYQSAAGKDKSPATPDAKPATDTKTTPATSETKSDAKKSA